MNIRLIRQLVACFVALFLTLVLASCGGAIPTPKPPPTISPITATGTTTITAMPTNTKIPPTETLPASIQEFDRKITVFNSNSKLWMCGDVYPSFMDFSPDNTWLASSCDDGGGYAGNLLLTHKDGIFWRMTDKQLFGISGWISFMPVKWSIDGKNLYFSTSHVYGNVLRPETPNDSLVLQWNICFFGES